MRRSILLLTVLSGCASPPQAVHPPAYEFSTGFEPVDHLIRPGERHFKHLWKLTGAGENAEAYWSFGGDRLSMQARNEDQGVMCDRIFVIEAEGGPVRQVSSGRGTTTCAYFLPGDREVLFASTQSGHEGCPPKPDFSQGYVWAVYAEHDIYVADLETGEERLLIAGPGYDAEATVSPVGDRIVFTSTRSGDLELWTCDLDGSNLAQVTDELGYDGGAFFSHDGTMLVFRATHFTEGAEVEEQEAYRQRLAKWEVKPNEMDIFVMNSDGSNRRRLTDLGRASFAPSFFPDDARIIFSSNYHDTDESVGLDFELFAIDLDSSNLERITFNSEGFESFDSFPLFSPDGRYLAFSSNRGQGEQGETNVFIAEWQ